MKKFTVLFIACLLFASCAFADVDLSGMSYDELVALKNKINLAMWQSEEWQEVTVPQGDWIVGEDIPEGTWEVKCADVDRRSVFMEYSDIKYGNLRPDGHIDYFSTGGAVEVYNPNHEDYRQGFITSAIIERQAGMVVRIDNYYAPAVFRTYNGKPDLGFK